LEINGASLCDDANTGATVFSSITDRKKAAVNFFFMIIFLMMNRMAGKTTGVYRHGGFTEAIGLYN
jgi:hypothetical protein